MQYARNPHTSALSLNAAAFGNGALLTLGLGLELLLFVVFGLALLVSVPVVVLAVCARAAWA